MPNSRHLHLFMRRADQRRRIHLLFLQRTDYKRLTKYQLSDRISFAHSVGIPRKHTDSVGLICFSTQAGLRSRLLLENGNRQRKRTFATDWFGCRFVLRSEVIYRGDIQEWGKVLESEKTRRRAGDVFARCQVSDGKMISSGAKFELQGNVLTVFKHKADDEWLISERA